MEHKTTEAHRKANYKYDKNFERINARLPKGTLDQINALGYKSGNAFLSLAVAEKLERETAARKKAQKN